MVLLVRTSEEKKHKRERFRRKQVDFTHRCKRSELSRSTYASGQEEFQTKEVLMVGERKYWSCEGSFLFENINFVHTIKILSA